MVDQSHIVLCTDCKSQIGRVESDGRIVIFSRHHGERHETVVNRDSEEERRNERASGHSLKQGLDKPP